jgi:hypothetical protein
MNFAFGGMENPPYFGNEPLQLSKFSEYLRRFERLGRRN